MSKTMTRVGPAEVGRRLRLEEPDEADIQCGSDIQAWSSR